jgi:hypothetical protein
MQGDDDLVQPLHFTTNRGDGAPASFDTDAVVASVMTEEREKRPNGHESQ